MTPHDANIIVSILAMFPTACALAWAMSNVMRKRRK